MIDTKKGFWLLPTFKRPSALRLFFDAYRKTNGSTPGLVLIDKADDSDYSNIPLPEGWKFCIVQGGCFANAMREGLRVWRESNGEESWVGYIADDNVPETDQWDIKLLESVHGWNIVNSNDGWQANADIKKGRMHGAVIWSGDLIREVGYLFPESLKHMFTETVWESLGRITGCWQTDMSVMVRHNHFSLTGAQDETAKRTNSFWDHDQEAFEKWLLDEQGDAIEAVIRVMGKYGQKTKIPDLHGKSVMIATPAGDGRYDRHYMRSWRQTIDFLQECGAKVEWVEMPYCGDLALARAKLMGTFYRSGFSHLMMIDSDQGWNPIDVIRLAQANRDFVAGAGPMKKYPITMCVNFPERGMLVEGDLWEAEKVGGAFVMVTRQCVARMVAAYPDLEFVTSGEGPSDYALFDPVFVIVSGKRWRFSEDYSFCWRWKHIGGRIFILPDIRLKHIGAHCFEAALADIVVRPNIEVKQAAE